MKKALLAVLIAAAFLSCSEPAPVRSNPQLLQEAERALLQGQWDRAAGQYEAFLAEKPVVTTADAGGPLEVVRDHENGLVCEPAAAALAEACSWLGEHPEDAQAWGQAGRRAAELLSWDRVIDRLLA